MGWGLFLRPTVLLGIALGLASLGLWVQRQQLDTARAERATALARAKSAEAESATATRANQAQARVIQALQDAANEWADTAAQAQAQSREAAKRAAARQADTERTLASITTRFAEYVRKPDCERLMSQDLEAVCAR